MAKTRNFIDRDAFEQLLRDVPRADGDAYQDVATIYGDMSRLVVGWLARTPPAELGRLYHEFGWKGDANARAMHEAAKVWLATHRRRENLKP
jgi:hypothetical protein